MYFKRMKNLIMILLLILIVVIPITSQAKNKTLYATKTIALKEATNDKSATIATVKSKTKLTITASWKKWVAVQYGDKTLYTKKASLHKKRVVNKFKGRSFKRRGRARWGGASWTWYTQRQLPGRGLKIPGRHLDKRGFVCDKDGYIVLASAIKYKKQRKILPTPFGKYGKVYDTNGTQNTHWRDVYTNW